MRLGTRSVNPHSSRKDESSRSASTNAVMFTKPLTSGSYDASNASAIGNRSYCSGPLPARGNIRSTTLSNP